MDLSATIAIDRPAAEVFEYAADVSHDSRWRTGVVEAGFTSDPPLRVGSTGFDRGESNGRALSVDWTVIDLEPGASVRWRLDSGPIVGTGGYLCKAENGRTRFTLEALVTPAGWYRLIGPIFARVGRRQNEADVAKLKALLEKGQ